MCGTIDGISDALTGAADAVGLKDAGDSITEGLGIRGPGDLLADFDDALYDVGVRWDSVGQIAAVAAAVYTGGVMAGAWGQGGWLANTLGVQGATAGATSTLGSTATGAAAAAGKSQAAMLAAQTAGFGAEGAAMTGQALASATGGAASLTNAGIMAGYSGNALAAGELGAAYGGLTNAGAQGVGLASTGYSPVASAKKSAIESSSFLSNPAVQYGLVQAGGQMIGGIGAAMSADEKLKQERDLINEQRQIAEDSRQRRSYWSSVVDARNRALAQRGLIGSNMA